MKACVDTNCRAFQLAVEVLARPWTAAILNSLQAGPRRYSELCELCTGVGDKVLSARLKDLEGRGILKRLVEPGPPVRVSYELTRKGRAFGRVAEAIERWGRELVTHEDGAKSRRRTA
jgi:DNA-binding HxlR family transcriptional regulator